MTATQTTAKCICGRALRAAKSVKLGYGPRCYAKIQKAAKVVDLAAYKANQIAKATELIELKAIVRTAPATFTAVSSDGTATYETNVAAQSCTCKAGERGIRCYHLAAAQILTAA
jgi:hypothetical protein